MTGPLRSSDHGYGNVTTRPLVDDGPQSCGDDRSHNEPHAPACPARNSPIALPFTRYAEMTAPTSGIGSWGETGGRLSSCVRDSGPINFSNRCLSIQKLFTQKRNVN